MQPYSSTNRWISTSIHNYVTTQAKSSLVALSGPAVSAWTRKGRNGWPTPRARAYRTDGLKGKRWVHGWVTPSHSLGKSMKIHESHGVRWCVKNLSFVTECDRDHGALLPPSVRNPTGPVQRNGELRSFRSSHSVWTIESRPVTGEEHIDPNFPSYAAERNECVRLVSRLL